MSLVARSQLLDEQVGIMEIPIENFLPHLKQDEGFSEPIVDSVSVHKVCERCGGSGERSLDPTVVNDLFVLDAARHHMAQFGGQELKRIVVRCECTPQWESTT